MVQLWSLVPEVLSHTCHESVAMDKDLTNQSQSPVMQNRKIACQLWEAWWEVQPKHLAQAWRCAGLVDGSCLLSLEAG